MRNYDELLARAEAGRLSPAEVEAVAQDLGRERETTDQEILLRILGEAGAVQHVDLVERFLDREDAPMLVRTALQILCTFWGLTDRYVDRLLGFVRGVPWDVFENVRLMAISIVGEYLRSRNDPRIVANLLAIFESEGEEQTVRENAYFALARAVGRDWPEIPAASRHFDLAREIDPTVLDEARRRALG